MIKKMIAGAAATLLLALPAFAQESAGVTAPLAYAYSDALYVMMPGSDTPLLVQDGDTYDYSAVWSPDGTKLAYTVSADGEPYSDIKTIKVWDGTQAIDVVPSFKAGLDMALNWTRDGKLLYFAMTEDMTEEGTYVEAYTVEPVSGAEPELVTNQLIMIGGCGGGSSYPMDWITWRENGFGGHPFGQLTDFGLVYPSACAANRAALFRTFSNELTPFNGGMLSDVVISPDQLSIVGLGLATPEATGRSLIKVNLETLEETVITTQNTPLQVAFGPDGSLYYASITEQTDLLAGLTDEEKVLYAGAIGITEGDVAAFGLSHNTLSISHVAVDGTETVLFEGLDAYTIGRMAVSGSTLYFSTISNPDAWLDAIKAGEVTMENNFEFSEGLVHTNLYSFNLAALDNVTPTLIMEDAAQFAVAGS